MGKLHFLQKIHDFYVNFKMHVIWMWMRFGSRLGPISNQFWSQFGVPKLLQKSSENSLFVVPFLNPFLWGLEALQVPLGSLPEPLMLILGASKTWKVWFPHRKMTLFENDTFWCFEALHGPLGPILAPSWPDLVPKRSRKWPQKLPKSGPKNGPKNYPPKNEF